MTAGCPLLAAQIVYGVRLSEVHAVMTVWIGANNAIRVRLHQRRLVAQATVSFSALPKAAPHAGMVVLAMVSHVMMEIRQMAMGAAPNVCTKARRPYLLSAVTEQSNRVKHVTGLAEYSRLAVIQRPVSEPEHLFVQAQAAPIAAAMQ